MGSSTREQLIKKRELAQLRRKRQLESAFYRSIAPKLCDTKVAHFCRVPAVDCARLMDRFSHLPAQDERLTWWDIQGSQRAPWDGPVERDDLVREALRACAQTDERVVLIQHTSEAGLSIGSTDLVKNLPDVLSAANGTVWITSKWAKPWLVEVSFTDKEVCYTTRQCWP